MNMTAPYIRQAERIGSLPEKPEPVEDFKEYDQDDEER